MPSPQWTCAALGLVGALSAYAQTSNVTQCIPSWQWSINNKTQTPCLVAAFLESACGMPTSIDSIPVNTHYLGPTGPKQNQCICSSVTYSLVSACGGCQGRNFQNWTTWSMNCDKPSLASFPLPIPSAVVVPNWAYINVSLTGGQLDPVVAQGVIAGVPPPSTTLPVSSSTTAPLSTPPVSSPTTPTTSPSNTSAAANSGSSGPNTGAIAGGVVGGLVVLAIIVLGAIWWFVWRRRNAVQSDLVFNQGKLISNINPPITQHATGSSGIPLTSIYDTTTGSNYPTSAYGTSAVYTSAPTASRRSEESISYSLAHFAGAGQQNPLQPVRQQPGFYRGTPELS